MYQRGNRQKENCRIGSNISQLLQNAKSEQL